jgi:pSer/pThr/pTyr-binding forkhead associated (FHA) protein
MADRVWRVELVVVDHNTRITPESLPASFAFEKPVPDDGEVMITIGRDPSNDVAVSAVNLSRRHAAIVLRGGVPHLVDLGSANGTRLNGCSIHGPTPISPADLLNPGGWIFRLVRSEVVAGS